MTGPLTKDGIDYRPGMTLYDDADVPIDSLGSDRAVYAGGEWYVMAAAGTTWPAPISALSGDPGERMLRQKEKLEYNLAFAGSGAAQARKTAEAALATAARYDSTAARLRAELDLLLEQMRGD